MQRALYNALVFVLQENVRRVEIRSAKFRDEIPSWRKMYISCDLSYFDIGRAFHGDACRAFSSFWHVRTCINCNHYDRTWSNTSCLPPTQICKCKETISPLGSHGYHRMQTIRNRLASIDIQGFPSMMILRKLPHKCKTMSLSRLRNLLPQPLLPASSPPTCWVS